jgi:hypothetical protein
MAITFVGTATTTESSSATSVAPALPAGWAAGDFGVAFCHKDDDAGDWTWSSGTGEWTQLDEWSSTLGNDYRWAVFYRVMQTGDTAPTFSTGDSAEECSGMIHMFRGVNNSSPWDQTHVKTEGENNSLPDAPDITTQTDGAWVITWHVATLDDINTAGAPTDYTVRGNVVGATMDERQQVVATREIASAGVQTIGAWTHSCSKTNAAEYGCVTFALKPRIMLNASTIAVGVATAVTASMRFFWRLNATTATTGVTGYVPTWTVTAAPSEVIQDPIGMGVIPFAR